MKRKKISWIITFFLVVSITMVDSSDGSETTDNGDNRRRLFNENNGYGSRGYSAFLEPKYLWKGNAWLYPTYPVAPVKMIQSHQVPQIWCHRYQSEVRCWDWNCHWDYHYNKCREMTLLGAVNEKPAIMTVQIALRVFACLVCIFVFTRLFMTACAACCCGGWQSEVKFEHNVDLYVSSDEDSSYLSD